MDVLNQVSSRFLALSLRQRAGVVAGTGFLYWLTKYLSWRWDQLSKPFNKYTSNEDAIDDLDLGGKIAIVTGCNIGIGKETARILAKQGCTVIMACRNTEKANNAKNEILQDLNLEGPTSDRLQVMKLDLSSLQSVREFADNFNAKNIKINYLINNAGIMALPDYRESADGYEMQFATNHLGHFYLTLLLMPSLLQTPDKKDKEGRLPRIINLSSIAHRTPTDYDWTMELFSDCLSNKNFMNGHKSSYNRWINYGISKTSNILFTRELQKRYNNKLITVSVHPGGVATGLSRHLTPIAIFRLIKTFIMDPTFYYNNFKPLSCGASTTLRCVSLDDNEILPGHYYANCNEANDLLMSIPKVALKDKGAMCEKLWELSETLIQSKGFSITP